MQEDSLRAQELLAWGVLCAALGSWIWGLPRVTPGEARGAGPKAPQRGKCEANGGCRGGVGCERKAQPRPELGTGPRGWVSPSPALRGAHPPPSPPPPPHSPGLSPVPRSAQASLQAPPAARPRPGGVLCASFSLYQGTFQRRDRTVR